MSSSQTEVVVDTKALLPADKPILTPTGDIISKQVVFTVAERLFKIYPQPSQDRYKLTKEEIVVTAEVALSMGCNPLAINKEYFSWKDKYGNLNIMRHYSYEVAWAQSKETFNPVDRILSAEEKKERNIAEEDFAVSVTIIRKSMESDYQKRYNMVFAPLVQNSVDPKEAMTLAKSEAMEVGVTAVGVVKYNEVYDNDKEIKTGTATLKGWEPGYTRAKVRAMRQAIHAAYGIPTTADLVKSGAFGKPLTSSGLESLAKSEDIIVESPDIQRRYAEIAETQSEGSDMGTKERITLMRGEKEEGIGEDWENGDFEESDDSPEELPPLEEAFEAEGPAITKDEALRLLYDNGVQDGNEVDGISASIYERPITELNEVELHNIVQYVRRRRILRTETNSDGKTLTIKQRFSQIPEIAKIKDKPGDIDEALTRLREYAQKMSDAGKMMDKVYIEEPEEAPEEEQAEEDDNKKK